MRFSVLLINPDITSLQNEIKELSTKGFNLVYAQTLEEAIEYLKTDGLIHVILTEWEIPVSKNRTLEKNQANEALKMIRGPDLYNALLKIRYDAILFLYTKRKSTEIFSAINNHSTDQLTAAAPKSDAPYTSIPFSSSNLISVSGYFFKGDKDYDDIVSKIMAEVNNVKNRAPFFETLVQYSKQFKDSWHTPGHAAGHSIRQSPWVSDYYDFFGANTFMSDLSVSVPMLDSLLHPKGIIKEAQELASRTFASRYTFFSTNGTSGANKILLQTLVKPGEAVLLDRNCHKSVHYGVIISGAEPIYLLPSSNNKYGIFGPVPKKRIYEALDESIKAGKKVKLLFLTNCTYDGLIYDIEDIVKEAHKRGVKVIVDEAWFGFARFHPEFSPCAMEAGADYSTQSTHKTMSAFSQASMIHVKDPDFEQFQDFFMENFNMHTSTSPQYHMIASLDVARKQMAMEGFNLLSKVLDLSQSLRASINSLNKFRVLELEDLISPEIANDGVRLDRTKVTIDTSLSGFTSKEVEHFLLNKFSIQIEKTTFNTLTILLTIGSTQSKINRLFLALQNIEKLSGNNNAQSSDLETVNFRLQLSPLKALPREAFYCTGEKVLLKRAKDRISTGMIVPYPPGIPFLVPGQIISEEIIESLQTYKDFGVEIHGLHGNLINVMSVEEEQKLKIT